MMHLPIATASKANRLHLKPGLCDSQITPLSTRPPCYCFLNLSGGFNTDVDTVHVSNLILTETSMEVQPTKPSFYCTFLKTLFMSMFYNTIAIHVQLYLPLLSTNPVPLSQEG